MLMAYKDEDLQHDVVVVVVDGGTTLRAVILMAVAGTRTATWKECTPIITSLTMVVMITTMDKYAARVSGGVIMVIVVIPLAIGRKIRRWRRAAAMAMMMAPMAMVIVDIPSGCRGRVDDVSRRQLDVRSIIHKPGPDRVSNSDARQTKAKSAAFAQIRARRHPPPHFTLHLLRFLHLHLH